MSQTPPRGGDADPCIIHVPTKEVPDVTALETPRASEVSYNEDYPEGGLQAWLVVLGSWCAMIPGMGLLNTLGVLHAWTATHQLKEYSASSIGWIYGAFGFFLYFCGAQVGMRFSLLF